MATATSTAGGVPPLPHFDDATAVPLSWSLFDATAGQWTDLPQRTIVGVDADADADADGEAVATAAATADQPIGLVTWNIDAYAHEHIARLRRLLEAIHRQCSRAAPTDTAPRDDSDTPDVIFLQEVSGTAKRGLLDNAWVRGSYYVSGRDWFIKDGNQPFYSITLVSRHRFAPADLGAVWRIDLPSRYGRYALCCDLASFAPPSSSPSPSPSRRVYRYVNVHLDSLAARPNKRPRQLEIVGAVLRCDGIAGGVVAGDFNPVIPEEDDVAVEANGLLDCWRVLQPDQDGFTWLPRGRETYPPRRMDKITVTTTTTTTTQSDNEEDGTQKTQRSALVPRTMEVLRPGVVIQALLSGHQAGAGAGEPGNEQQARAPTLPIAWSDHCGLYATFTQSTD